MLGYIRGERYSLAVDAGNSRRHVEKFYAALDAAELRRPDFTVLTHWHWDHTFGLHAVDGAAIACEATNEMLCRASRWKWSEEAMRERLRTGEEIEFCDKHIRAEYPDRKEISVVPASLVFHGRLSIDLGGVHCVLLQTEAPHERDCVLVHVPEQGILFAGDADCGDFYSLDGGYDKARSVTLRRWKQWSSSCMCRATARRSGKRRRLPLCARNWKVWKADTHPSKNKRGVSLICTQNSGHIKN